MFDNAFWFNNSTNTGESHTNAKHMARVFVRTISSVLTYAHIQANKNPSNAANAVLDLLTAAAWKITKTSYGRKTVELRSV